MAGVERSRGQFVFLDVCGGSAQNLRPKWTIQPSRPFLDGRDEAFLSASVTIVYFVFYALVVEFDPAINNNKFHSGLFIHIVPVYNNGHLIALYVVT